MSSKSYSDKLQDPRWQKKRLEIMQRDDFTCQLCQDKKTTLNIHHKEYLPNREPWEYEDDSLITYCKYCHKVIEAYKEDAKIQPIIAKKYRTPDQKLVIVHTALLNSLYDQVYLEMSEFDEDNGGEKVFIGLLKMEMLKTGIELIEKANTIISNNTNIL